MDDNDIINIIININNNNDNDDEQCVYVTRSESGRLLIQHKDDDTSLSCFIFMLLSIMQRPQLACGCSALISPPLEVNGFD